MVLEDVVIGIMVGEVFIILEDVGGFKFVGLVVCIVLDLLVFFEVSNCCII